jgi:hypothetical protein
MTQEDNAFDWDDLLCCMAERTVIPIIGRELLTVSVGGQQMLLERYLAERLANRLDVRADEFGNGCDLNAVATAYLRQGGDAGKIYTALVSVTGERISRFATPTSLDKLAEITDFRLFISTTFDSLLCQALSEKRPGCALPEHCLVYSPHKSPRDHDYDLPDEVSKLRGTYVHHLFGLLSTKGDYAVTDEDYLEFVSQLQARQRPTRLFDEFKRNHILFLGCGFENWLERFFIRAVRDERFDQSSRSRLRQVVADRQAGGGGSLAVFLQLYRMQVYRQGDPVGFVDELHRRWCERNPITAQAKPLPPSARMEPGTIFLSYASEDRSAARNMYEALREAGLDVWFDQSPSSLEPGDDWDQQIRANIRRCAVFVPMISRHAQERKEGYFRREWKWAIDRSEGGAASLRFIQPVVLDDTGEDVPDIPPQLWDRQCVRFPEGRPTPEYVEGLKTLVQQQRKVEGGYR